MNRENLNDIIDKINNGDTVDSDDKDTASLIKNLKSLKDVYYKDADIVKKIKRKNRRRIMLKSAMIAAVLILSLSMQMFDLPFSVTKTKPSPYKIVYAMKKAYRDVKTVMLDTNIVEMDIKTNKVTRKESWKELYAGPFSYRIENSEQVMIADGDKSLGYGKKEKTGALLLSDPMASPFSHLKSQIDDIYKYGNYKLIGSEKVNGIDTNVIEVNTELKDSKNHDIKKTDTYWVDKKTNYIVKQEEINGDNKKIVSYNIDTDTLVNKNDLKLNIPKDITIYDTFKQMYIYNTAEEAKSAVEDGMIIPDKMPDDLKFFKAWIYKNNDRSFYIHYYNEDFTKTLYIEETKKGASIVLKFNSNYEHDELKPLIDDLKSKYKNIIIDGH